ncbi:hypothetical protein FPV67DRAFT_222959 [Lyophyllum atratum]|nr:hypothetical protein FPV67DRAFT_222959 [Lyophyllum atratum]
MSDLMLVGISKTAPKEILNTVNRNIMSLVEGRGWTSDEGRGKTKDMKPICPRVPIRNQAVVLYRQRKASPPAQLTMTAHILHPPERYHECMFHTAALEAFQTGSFERRLKALIRIAQGGSSSSNVLSLRLTVGPFPLVRRRTVGLSRRDYWDLLQGFEAAWRSIRLMTHSSRFFSDNLWRRHDHWSAGRSFRVPFNGSVSLRGDPVYLYTHASGYFSFAVLDASFGWAF